MAQSWIQRQRSGQDCRVIRGRGPPLVGSQLLCGPNPTSVLGSGSIPKWILQPKMTAKTFPSVKQTRWDGSRRGGSEPVFVKKTCISTPSVGNVPPHSPTFSMDCAHCSGPFFFATKTMVSDSTTISRTITSVNDSCKNIGGCPFGFSYGRLNVPSSFFFVGTIHISDLRDHLRVVVAGLHGVRLHLFFGTQHRLFLGHVICIFRHGASSEKHTWSSVHFGTLAVKHGPTCSKRASQQLTPGPPFRDVLVRHVLDANAVERLGRTSCCFAGRRPRQFPAKFYRGLASQLGNAHGPTFTARFAPLCVQSTSVGALVL